MREMHADVRSLGFLLGTWRGDGEGVWPPGEPFRYAEEMLFEHAGDAFLMYAERSWGIADDEPLHFERGFLRLAGDDGAELVLAHPLGLAEVAEGTLAGFVLDLTATALPRTATGSNVTGLRRRIEVAGDVLRYELWMAIGGGEVTRHLVAELERADA